MKHTFSNSRIGPLGAIRWSNHATALNDGGQRIGYYKIMVFVSPIHSKDSLFCLFCEYYTNITIPIWLDPLRYSRIQSPPPQHLGLWFTFFFQKKNPLAFQNFMLGASLWHHTQSGFVRSQKQCHQHHSLGCAHHKRSKTAPYDGLI